MDFGGVIRNKMRRIYKVKFGTGELAGRASVVDKNGCSVITAIGVDKKYRKLGFGKKLMEKIIKKEFHINDCIMLECRPNAGMEERVKAWYERLGFVSTGEGKWMILKKS